MIEQNKDLTGLTTFGIAAKAAYYAAYSSAAELDKIIRSEVYRNNEVLNIGAGSNLLFVNDYKGLVLHSNIFGKVKYQKDAETCYAIAGAGENWAEFVDWCVEEGLSGIENLAYIPGDVGSSAVQNVGAYGVEAGDIIHSVEVMETATRKIETIPGEECGFGYRESKFKHEWKGRYIVLRVSFKLHPTDEAMTLNYGPLKGLKERLGHTPTIKEVRDEIVEIRKAKLPDPKDIGSAGSFFKNPVIDEYYFHQVVEPHAPEMPNFPTGEGRVKLSAAWLIDHAGLKGCAIGGAKVYEKQPLVIVNQNNATAADVVALCRTVQHEVKRRYGVDLQPEVNFIDTGVRVTVLGTGTSKGVPEVGCGCEVCHSGDIHDKRLRASVYVETHGMNILIDPSPDFRAQALANDLQRPDAVLITHSHYDHVGGLDDLRPYCANADVDLYATEDVEGDLRRRLDYCFKEHPYPGVPTFKLHRVENREFEINGLKITPIRVLHGKLPIIGYRIGEFAYITDASAIEEDEMEKLEGVDVLIINALRHKPHFAHFSLEEALEIIKKVKPRRAYLTHICHDMGLHKEVNAQLPENVELAYDGLHIQIK
jgi:phosphoribosyl 1,2-cyclic phosphate phosphodiesterase